MYDVGEDRGVYYIVMELVEGITLKDYIDRKGKLSVKEATSIAIQVSLVLKQHTTAILYTAMSNRRTSSFPQTEK